MTTTTARKATTTATTRKATTARKTTTKATTTKATESATTTGQTHAGIDIAGLRLMQEGPDYWVAYKGTDRRMGVVSQMGPGRFVATGRGMALVSVDSVQEGGEFIARSHAGKQSERVRTPQQIVTAELKDCARGRNRFRTFKSMAHKSAHVTIPARIARLEAMAGKASDRHAERDGRATLAGTEIAARRLADAQVAHARAIETAEWADAMLEAENTYMRALRDRALGLGIKQAEIEAIVASVRKVKPEDQARELAELAALLAE